MDDPFSLTIILIFGAVLGVIPAVIAASKGHSFVVWWAFGTLLFIIALPVAILLTPGRKELAKWTACVYCNWSIKASDKACERCGRAQPQAFWSKKSSTANWEKTVEDSDEVAKWAKKNDGQNQ